jgi:hypothetical protein
MHRSFDILCYLETVFSSSTCSSAHNSTASWREFLTSSTRAPSSNQALLQPTPVYNSLRDTVGVQDPAAREALLADLKKHFDEISKLTAEHVTVSRPSAFGPESCFCVLYVYQNLSGPKSCSS